jgi:hypothetical protein
MHLIKLPFAVMALALSFLLYGCGEKTVVSPGGNSVTEQSDVCAGCHLNFNSPGTLKPIVDEYKKSVHYTSNAAGCADCHFEYSKHVQWHPDCTKCHGGSPLTGTPGLPPFAIRNPDGFGSCAKCHKKGFSWGVSSYDGVAVDIQYAHYSTGTHANYVATNYVANCRKCHNPHNTTFGREQRQQWARSGHGISPLDGKGRGSSLPAKDDFGNFCVRCHTSSGYIAFVSSGFSDVNALADTNGIRSNYPEYKFVRNQPDPYTYADKSREATNCNVCHSDGRQSDGSAYSGKLRSVSASSIWYTYSSHPAGSPLIRAQFEVKYDSLGGSNICVPCHAGRESGDIIKVADRLGLFDYTGTTSATRPSGISPHDFASAANLSGKSGFHFYTSGAKYTANPTHKTQYATIGGTNGPCVGCHMKNDRSHLFEPVEWRNGNIYETVMSVRSEAGVCIKCHDGSAGKARRDASAMNQQRDRYRAAVVALGKMIPASNNWKVFGNYSVPGSGKIRAGAYTMGANFVYNMLFTDPGGYTHNPTYTKQLIYDSIDWLADGKMDFGSASSQVYNKVNSLSAALTYSKGSPAVLYGQNGVPNGLPFTKTQVLEFICKNYDVNNPTICERW